MTRLSGDAGFRSGQLSPLPPLAASSGSTRAQSRMASGLAVASPVQPVWGRTVLGGLAASWLFSPRRQALTLLTRHYSHLRCLTFELSGRQRQDAGPGPVKMHRVPPARAWWPAVGAPLERGVRQRCVYGRELMPVHAADSACREAPRQEQSRYSASAAQARRFAWRAVPCSAYAVLDD
jgi:hypothetical protein